jgi:capsular polysaccharide biosynthesis protein
MRGHWKEKIKDAVLAVLRSSAFYRKRFFIPEAVVTLAGLPNVTISYLDNAPLENRRIPLTTDDDIYWKYKQSLVSLPQQVFVLDVRGWRVWGNQGAVVTDDGRLLGDVSREFEKEEHSIFKQLKLVPPVILSGTSVILSASGADMYYHWMFDILPRLQLLKTAGFDSSSIDHYILDYRDIPFQREALATLDIPLKKICRANDHFGFHIRAERLIVPSLPSRLDEVAAFACRFLRETFLNEHTCSSYGERIYLKRSGKRSITNELEIEDYLQEQGFETILCEQYTIAQQAVIFNNARIIVGPHGAAFSNVVFCKPGTKVLEFFSPRWINPCYWTICNHIKATYYYLVGEGTPPDAKSDAEGTNAVIELNLEKLKKLINHFNILN